MKIDLTKNAGRFSGEDYVNLYDLYRPSPPMALIDLARQYAGGQVDHVIDLGCGSGLSAMVWKNKIKILTAVDPGRDMISAAKRKFKNDDSWIRFVEAYAHDVPLESQCADMITCSQSFHWMNPGPTLDEINRLLKPNGVLVIYDCMWPPSVCLAWETAYIQLFKRVKQLTDTSPDVLMHFWDKNKHQDNVGRSGHFSMVKTVGFHKIVVADASYFIGLAETQGGVEGLRKLGLSDEEIGWLEFIEKIAETPMAEPCTFTLHYKCIFAIKNNGE